MRFWIRYARQLLDVFADAGRVVEQMADRDGVEARVELRQKLSRLVGDRKLSLVFELQDRRGRKLFDVAAAPEVRGVYRC